MSWTLSNRVLYSITAAFQGIVFLTFLWITSLLFHRLLCKDYNWQNDDKPTKWTKGFALLCSIFYMIGYGAVTFNSIEFAINGGPSNANISSVIAAVMAILALLSFHSYLLNRVDFQVNNYEKIITYHCCFTKNFYGIVSSFLVLLFVMFATFASLRVGSGSRDYSVTVISVVLVLCIYIIDLIISVLLLVIYIKSCHQIAIKIWFDNRRGNVVNCKQHELMIKAARIMVIQCWYILFTFLLYSWTIFSMVTPGDMIDGISYRTVFIIGHTISWTMIILTHLFTVSALFFGFEFGHPPYLKYCCCTKEVQRKCENLIEYQNSQRSERDQYRYHVFDEVELMTVGSSNDRVSDSSSRANDIILSCCCCRVHVKEQF